MAQFTRDTEAQHLARNTAVKDQRRVAQRTEGHGNGPPIHRIIYNLMPCQIADRIGARFGAVDLNRDDRLARGDAGLCARGFEFRCIKRRDTILRRAA